MYMHTCGYLTMMIETSKLTFEPVSFITRFILLSKLIIGMMFLYLIVCQAGERD